MGEWNVCSDREYNIQILQQTLKIMEEGGYKVGNRHIPLHMTRREHEEVIYLSQEKVADLREHLSLNVPWFIGHCGYWVEAQDTLSTARSIADSYYYRSQKNAGRILVLNFASPHAPDMGAKSGRNSQEADLCRKTTLLASLGSEEAAAFYEAHREQNRAEALDACVLSPNVELIWDENGTLLGEPMPIAVLSCVAPSAVRWRGSKAALEKILYDRIQGMLHVAAAYGYQYLVLGPWGCGRQGNDVRQIAHLFYQALKEFRCGNHTEKDLFRIIAFATGGQEGDETNQSFQEYFGDFYWDEDEAERRKVLEKIKATEVHLNKICGGLFGGAVGDALGYPVEFLSEEEIRRKYGKDGIQEYELDFATGQALISDDTQMSLFTANGILFGDTRGCLRGNQSSPSSYVYEAYKDWYRTQTGKQLKGEPISWLLDIPELHSRRAPGNTCLSALGSGMGGSVKVPINQSKGCGGIMRVAPLALHYHLENRMTLDKEGAEIAALTHGHPLGYIPAAVLSHIVNVGVYGGCSKGERLEDAVEEAMEAADMLFEGNACLPELRRLVEQAIALAGNDRTDSENIRELGQGWVAEETLAIAVYCSLRYQDDFSKGVISAVNHSGDSDSTGAVTGNILGAWLGYEAIEEKWKQNLELKNIILEMAEDLCHGCQLSEYSSYRDPVWESKYVEGRYRRQTQKEKE